MSTTARKTTIAAIAVTAAGITAAGCGSTVAKTPASQAPAAAATSAPTTTAASPSPSAPLTGPVGTSYQVTGDNGPQGATTVYTVTLDQVQQQATLGQYETLTNGSDHVTAAEFTITGKTGQTSDDANTDAVVVGTDSQNYQSAADTITAGTDFKYGDFNVSAGQTVTGWVSFELAQGVTIASVQWAPGFESQTATWTVGK